MNIFKLMQAMRPYIQRGDMTYDLAVKYLKERGVQFDGIVKKALDNMFKKIKARDPVFDKSVTKMPIDDAGTPFNPNTLKSTVSGFIIRLAPARTNANRYKIRNIK